MKRYISIILFLITLLLPLTQHAEVAKASASGALCAASSEESTGGFTYAVAAERDVWFYTEADESKGLFLMPYTYYVKVLNQGDPFCLVEYQDDAEGFHKLTGYCRKDKLTFVDFQPARPYLKKTVTLTYTIDSDTPVGGGSFNNMERTVKYYGSYYAGTALYYYVYAEGVFDYVPALEPVTYDLNTDYLQTASGKPEQPNEESGGSLNTVQIIVICAFCIAAALVAFFVLRGKKPLLAHREEDSD